MIIYEVQKFGVTLEWTTNIQEAEGSFNGASPGEVVMYRIEGDRKYAIRRK